MESILTCQTVAVNLSNWDSNTSSGVYRLRGRIASKGSVWEVAGDEHVEDTVMGDDADMIVRWNTIPGRRQNRLNTIQTDPNSPSHLHVSIAHPPLHMDFARYLKVCTLFYTS